MSQDKLHALGNILAGVFRDREPTKMEPAPSAFFDGERADRDKFQALDSMPTEVTDGGIARASPDFDMTEFAPPTSFDQPTNGEPTDQTPVDAPPEAGNPSIRAEQAKSLLSGLDLDTAIRLRWALRDIKAKRTKLTPVSPSDLKTLIEMGLVEMRDDAQLLTSEGHQALDQ